YAVCICFTISQLTSQSYLLLFFFFLTLRCPPRSTLFPYTTLFRSRITPISRGEKMSYIDVMNESKFYGEGDTQIAANDKVSFSIAENEFAIIVGPSGACKSTLLNILGGMDNTDEGQILIDGTDIAQFNEKQLTNYRREDIGFIFQNYNLIPNLTTLENVEMAAELVDHPLNPEEVVEAVGLGHRINN